MYHIIAFYYFGPIENPKREVKEHKRFFEERDIMSRIYINEKGINAQMSASPDAGKEYIDWINSKYPDIHFKIDEWHDHVFPKKAIKYREKLVGYDREIDCDQQGQHLSPMEWRENLESDEEKVLIDVRNDYEWKLGRFEGAELPDCKTFKDFEEYAIDLKKRVDPAGTKVMMYCTGGIRCELYSSVMKEHGFESVFQLDGGVINYGHQEGGKHWLGKLFVFDDRMAVPISKEETEVIGRCYHCDAPADEYYNCANMECNYLFLSCRDCLERLSGCCKEECKCGDHVRPHQTGKPFRKWYNYGETKPAQT